MEVLSTMAALQRIIALNRLRRRRSEVVYMNKFIHTTFNPLEVLSDEAIIRKYRLSRVTIQDLIHFVHPHLVRATRHNYALSPAVQLLAALRFYASGSFYEVLGDGLGLSKASISRAVTAVTQVLLQLDKRITFTKTPEDARVNQGFHAIADIPQVIGVIDGTLVPIARPSNNEAVYLCRKGYQALNIQVVCDYQGLFTDIVAKWPGSTHDAFMWANSALCRVAEAILHNTALRANVQLPDDEENSVEDTEDDYLLQHDGMHPAGLELSRSAYVGNSLLVALFVSLTMNLISKDLSHKVTSSQVSE
ncbi:hypothetical protein NFI96_003976 [Prochilodus magdalenae]|nr:hypothetical protein NFI96_003976 [Prochilodus magdalenae]